MELNINAMDEKGLRKLEKMLETHIIEDIRTYEGQMEVERISNMLQFLYQLKLGNKQLIDALKECKIIGEEVLPMYERKIRTMAISDEKDRILYNHASEKKYWSSSRLHTFLSIVAADKEDIAQVEIAKSIYKKHKKAMVTKIGRLKTGKKVQELASIHPTIDIERAMAYGIVTGKLSNTEDDIIWLDNLIRIIQTPKKI